MRIVVMGGRSSATELVAAAVAAAQRARVIDGRELAPPPRRSRTADTDREAWFRALQLAFGRDGSLVVSSALLPRADRDRVRSMVADVTFVELVAGPPAGAPRRRRWRRAERELPSQDGDPLASDERGVRVADDADLGSVVERILVVLSGRV